MSGGINNQAEIVHAHYKLVQSGVSEKQANIEIGKKLKVKPQTVQTYVSRAKLYGTYGSEPETEEKKEVDVTEKLEQSLEKQTEKSKVRYWENQAKFYRDQLKSQEAFLETIAQHLPRFPIVTPPKTIKSHSKQTTGMATCLCSDWHGNRTVSALQTEGYGEFNFEILSSRWWDICQKIVSITEIHRSVHNIQELWLPFLGDIGNDEHRPENIASNEMPNMLAAFRIASIAVQGIRYQLQFFQKVHIDGICGNEPRLSKKPTAKYRFENWDFLIYNIMKLALSEEIKRGRVTFNIPLSPAFIVSRMGFDFLLSHGDDVKGGFAGQPHYGIDRYESRQHQMRRPRKNRPHTRDFDRWLHGHFHTFYERGDKIGNGALTGTDEYAQGRLGLSCDPIQGFTILTEDHCDTMWYKLNAWEAKGHPFELGEDVDLERDISALSRSLVRM